MTHPRRVSLPVANRLRQVVSRLSWASALLTLSLTACSSSSTDSTPDNNASAGAGSMTDADVGTILSSAVPCTKPNTVCMAMDVPASLDTQPSSLLFELFDSAGIPNHEPNGYAGIFTAPMLTAGDTIYVELTDGGLQGDYWLWTIMYMSPDGHGAPVIGVDYGQSSTAAALHLDGTPLNISDPITLSK
jgi:hypothetical protein